MRPVNPRPSEALPLSPAALSAVPLPQSTIGPVMKMASPPSISEEERPAVGCRKGGIKWMNQCAAVIQLSLVGAVTCRLCGQRNERSSPIPAYLALLWPCHAEPYSPHIRVSEGMSAACFPSMYILYPFDPSGQVVRTR